MRYRLAFNRMASALRLAGSIYVSLNSLKVMKESNNKTSGQRSRSREARHYASFLLIESSYITTGLTLSGQCKSAEKSSRTTTSRTSSASRGTASSQSSGSGRTSRSNNPEGHNQYTKKSQDNR